VEELASVIRRTVIVRRDIQVTGQAGITGLETAIILIAFVVVASVFAFTVLSAGVFSSERSKETIYQGVDETETSLSPKGSTIVATGDVSGTTAVTKVTFNVTSSVKSGGVIDLTPPYTADDTGVDPDLSGLESPSTVSFTDDNQHTSTIPWTIRFLGGDNGDYLLDRGEMAEITVWFHELTTGAGTYTIGTATDAYLTSRVVANDTFTLLFDPGSGAVVDIQRTIPARLDPFIHLK
jgi:flagellin FlaB